MTDQLHQQFFRERVHRWASKLKHCWPPRSAKSWLLANSIRHDSFVWQAETAADWRTPPLDWPGTRYMQKAEKQGRKSAWFRFSRV